MLFPSRGRVQGGFRATSAAAVVGPHSASAAVCFRVLLTLSGVGAGWRGGKGGMVSFVSNSVWFHVLNYLDIVISFQEVHL